MIMGIDKPAIRERLQKFDFTGVFTQELGWDFPAAKVTVSVAGQVYSLLSVAQKRGVQVLQCPPGADGRIPDHATRRKIEKQVTKSAYEHLIIFVDQRRPPRSGSGSPDSRASRPGTVSIPIIILATSPAMP